MEENLPGVGKCEGDLKVLAATVPGQRRKRKKEIEREEGREIDRLS